jgi:dTDP-4-dehydrorhamnose 3,5-epimerase
VTKFIQDRKQMKFTPTPLHGAFLVEPQPRFDERGFFSRFYCEREFAQAGLINQFVQINNSLSVKGGTFRGMHYQLAPHAEVKVMRCLKGGILDVLLDLRPDSPSFGKWYAAELNEDNRTMMYVPRGVAHGILTLKDHTEVLYLVSAFYEPSSERGIRYDDPRFGIELPFEPAEISDKDRNWPDFDPDHHGVEMLRGLL